MRLIKARVLGFQSFDDSGEIEFADGINLIVGQNNSGKSALLRALLPVLVDDRHRTPEKWATHQLSTPSVEVVIELSGQELRESVLRFGAQHIPVPVPNNDPNVFIAELWARNTIRLALMRQANSNFYPQTYPSYDVFLSAPDASKYCTVAQPNGGDVQCSGIMLSAADSLPGLVADMWQQDMFFFTSERFALGESGHGHAIRLQPNAQNLPAVLHTLNGTRGSVFRRLVSHLREIFTTVGNLSISPTPTGNIEIRVWPTEEMDRVELSFPLNSGGTGVSQVIALLTAIMTVDNAVLIIDEINSFLHPAAVKSLLRILQTEYGHHQYIISTHAPEVIGFSNPRTIHLVKREGYESNVRRLDLGEISAFREVADHLGVAMADVFAADRIIWVEGPTEELCFPFLYQQVARHAVPRGTLFTSVMATGDFLTKKRDKKLIYEIYRRLSQVAVPLVVSVAFSFDSENLSEIEKSSMVNDSQGAMHFLPRRHIECYLIDPSSIAKFIADRDLESKSTVTEAMARRKLIDLGGTSRFKVSGWNNDLTNTTWSARVDAANLIAETCTQLSENRVTFNKKDDTLTLLQLVQDKNPEQIEELSHYVNGLVQAVLT